jgi:6,7-dimethyl-8-ribityllumazine synthase
VIEREGQLRHVGRIGVVVSRYNELITRKLLGGAVDACLAAGTPRGELEVNWVDGAFDLPAVASVMAQSGRYAALVALGAVIRGDTPHFEYVAGECARGLMRISVRYGLPVALGVLTCETMEQALERSGGAAGNKGREAAEAAIRAADVITRLRSGDA